MAELTIRCRHGSQLLDLSDTLLGVESREVNASELLVLTVNAERCTVQLIIVVHLVVDTLGAHHARFVRVLALELLHLLEISLVVHLEATRLDLILPDLIVQLHVVEDGVHEALNVRVLVGQQFENDLDHLRLVEHDFTRGLEEEQLEECLQYLLHHLIVLLLGTEQIL